MLNAFFPDLITSYTQILFLQTDIAELSKKQHRKYWDNALWCFDGTLNPALNGLYPLMRQSDHYQIGSDASKDITH